MTDSRKRLSVRVNLIHGIEGYRIWIGDPRLVGYLIGDNNYKICQLENLASPITRL